MDIKRYNFNDMIHYYDTDDMVEHESGKYVAYLDHLQVVKELEDRIETLEEMSNNQFEKIESMKCEECNGYGTLNRFEKAVGRDIEVRFDCPTCNGTGEIASEPVEVCEWTDNTINCDLPNKVNEYWMMEMKEYDFKYCPYCGKEIRIKE